MGNIHLNRDFSQDIIVDRCNVSQNSTTKWNHYHNFYELYFFNGNKMQYFIDNDVYEIEKNEIVLVDKLLLHRTLYAAQSRGQRTLVLINPNVFSLFCNALLKEKIESLFKNKTIYFNNKLSLNFVCDALDRLVYCFSLQESAWKKEKMLFILSEILLTLLELTPKCFEYEKNKLRTPKEKHVYDIISYLTNNYAQNISLETLSHKFFIDKHYICHLFKQTTGLTVIGFLNAKRLCEAERMLLYTNLNITQICHNIGFNSTSYFIKLFKSHYNCSPTQFRACLH